MFGIRRRHYREPRLIERFPLLSFPVLGLLLLALGCAAGGKPEAGEASRVREMAGDGPPLGATPEDAPEEVVEGEHVVLLLHGLLRTSRSMHALEEPLREAGLSPRTWGYPSSRNEVSQHGQALREELERLQADPDVGRIDLVTHSLGGIVARSALSQGAPSKVHRVVMLAPPNQGSGRAVRWEPWVGNLIRPLRDLTDPEESSLLAEPAPAGVQVGVIAGSRDWTCPEKTTHLEGEQDHVVVGSGHTFIMNKAATHRQVLSFLRRGRFEHADTN